MSTETKAIPEGAYYSTDPEAETLSHDQPEEALTEWRDNLPDEDWRSRCPVTLYVWRREVIAEAFAAQVARDAVERAVESYDGDYGPVDEPTDWPDKALAKAHRAIERALGTLFASRPVWRCTRTAEVVLDAEQVAAMLGEAPEVSP